MNPGIRQHLTASCLIRECKALPRRLRPGTRELCRLQARHKRQGHAAGLLERVTQEADDAGLILLILVDDDAPVWLGQFYARWGFNVLQASPLILARPVGSTPRFVQPVVTAAQQLIARAAA